MALTQQSSVTEAEYFALEAASDEKHEYADGQIIAMTGASWRHNLICVNISTTLNQQRRETACRVVANDLRLQTVSGYRYPDVMVICDDPAFVDERTDTIRNPTLIVEVLSKRTALTDHNSKLDEYIRIPSVQAYLLISQSEAKVERYLRRASGDWLYTQLTGVDKTLTLPSLDCHLALRDVYNKVDLPSTDDD